jgi:hypothetical protein
MIRAAVASILRPTALPSIGDIIFLSLLLVLALSTGEGLLGDGDTGYHIRTGDLILRSWEVPTRDPYSFHEPPLQWTAHEWLSAIIMATVFYWSGLTGIVIFFAVLLTITHWALYHSLRSRSGDILLCVLVTLLATVSSSGHWLARPHVFSLLFTVLWCHCLDRFQYRDENRLIYLPFLMALWVNLHGGFMFGLILLTIYFLGNISYKLLNGPASLEHGRKAKSLALTLIASIAVCLINPYGAEILWFPFRVTSDRFIMDHVTEFLSPNFHDVLPFKYMLLATIGSLALSRSALNLIEVSLILLLSYMALYSARHVSIFAIVVAPILLRSLDHAVRTMPNSFFQIYQGRVANLLAIDSKARSYFWPAAGLLFVGGLTLVGALQYAFDERKFPVAAVEFIKRERLTGNMFNNDEFGDYLIFAAWPAYRVFIDGRSDMYGEEYGRDYLRIANAHPGWKEVLAKYNITWVLFDTASPLTVALVEQKDWRPIYSDKLATLIIKNVPSHSALFEKYPSVPLPIALPLTPAADQPVPSHSP